jgi:hypothetical protein
MALEHRVFGDILEISVASPSMEMNAFAGAVSRVLSDPEVKPGMKLLVIVQPDTKVPLSSDAFRILNQIKGSLEKYFSKIAGVAFTEVHLGLMRVVFSSLRHYGLSTKVFRDRNEAIRWLIR